MGSATERWVTFLDRPAMVVLRHAAARITEPALLFPALAILLLALVWTTTINLVWVERAAAQRTAAASSQELAETYEAQVVRALREIDQALKVVKFSYEHGHTTLTLKDLKARALLPPDLLFVVTIVDSQGRVLDSTRSTALTGGADQDDVDVRRNTDRLWLSGPVPGRPAADQRLRFSRRIDAPDGAFAGTVRIAVDASYFVSGYDEAKLGQHGVIGLIGTDGVFRVRRSGDSIDVADLVSYATVLVNDASLPAAVDARVDAWDGVRRYTTTRPLYGFPLAVVVGLSQSEQLASSRNRMVDYLERAGIGSVFLLLVIAALRGLSMQLALSRQRAATEQTAHALRIEHFAYHDGLTGLPNRALFSTLLGKSVERARRHRRQVGVLFIDLDAFRPVNDSFGHAAGDSVLVETASRLQRAARRGDTVARVGGDGFLLLVEDVTDLAECETLATRLIDALRDPFAVPGHAVQLSACVGIALFPQHGEAIELVPNADAAMYTAKRTGGGTYAIFDSRMEGKALEQLELLNHLRHALELGQMSLHYQPKINGFCNEMSGVEALLRWQHPELGSVSPVVFIPIAERFGLIHDLGNWVIDESCRQMRAWADLGVRVRVAINVSAHQLRKDDLVERIDRALSHHQLEASQLLVEITESVMMEDIKTTQTMFEGLARIGVYLSIDDFGTGHSSLSYLRQLPAKQLKIDRSFVNDLESSSDARAIVDAVIRLAHALGLVVVAEGVESAGQRDILLQLECDELQGYLFSMPMPADALLAWISQWDRTRLPAPAETSG